MEFGIDIHGLASETSVAAGLNQIAPHVKRIGPIDIRQAWPEHLPVADISFKGPISS
jgi:hypothetical protein